MNYCGKNVSMGQGMGATCGEKFYNITCQCPECKAEDKEEITVSFAQAILDKCIQSEGDWGECIYCYEGGWGSPEKHKDDCEVTKAQQYLDSIKETL